MVKKFFKDIITFGEDYPGVSIGFFVLTIWIIGMVYFTNKELDIREMNIGYVRSLSSEKQLEILKMCYTSYQLNCNNAVTDYRKVVD